MSEKKEEKKLKSETSKRQTSKENPEQKKKVEAELEAESSSEEEEVKVSRVGYVEMRLKKKEWKAVYCVVIGGSFYYYKSSTDTEPKGSVDLNGLKIVTPDLKGEKKNSHLRFKKKRNYYLLVLVQVNLNLKRGKRPLKIP